MFQARISMLVQFRPEEARAAAGWLATLVRPSMAVSWDAGRGHLELGNVRGADLPALRDALYRHGARCVFVRYAHEGRPLVAEPMAAPVSRTN